MGEKPVQPVRARTPYMFFVREAREFVKTNKNVPKRDIMLEVGKLWNIIKSGQATPGVNALDHYEKLSKDDLERFKSAHTEYVSKINSMRHKNIKESQ